jgi:hypothetical protein
MLTFGIDKIPKTDFLCCNKTVRKDINFQCPPMIKRTLFAIYLLSAINQLHAQRLTDFYDSSSPGHHGFSYHFVVQVSITELGNERRYSAQLVSATADVRGFMT